MFDGIEDQRIAEMTSEERRWFDNLKKAFRDSDTAFQNGTAKDRCLAELFAAIDVAARLRKSLLGDAITVKGQRRRFIEFLELEIPSEKQFKIRDSASGELVELSIAEVIYDARNKIVHENENLNVAEGVNYHIKFDWSNQGGAGYFLNDEMICDGFFLWNRVRQVLGLFIQWIDHASVPNPTSFSFEMNPPVGSITPRQE